MIDITQEMKDFFGEDYIINYYSFIYNKAYSYLTKNKLELVVWLDINQFDSMFTSILVDLKRMSLYHNTHAINFVKLCSYAASWWIKRKPYRVVEYGSNKSLVYINENFASTLLFLHIYGTHVPLTECKKEKIQTLVRHTRYHLRYRNTNPQVLELYVNGLIGMI